jgi:HEAT repeat protein
MRLTAYASVLFSVLFFAIAFPFNKVVTASFPDEAGVAGFLGLFSSITTAVTFVVSLVLANRVYARLGIVNSVLLMPLTYLFGFAVFAGLYSLNGGVIARFSQLVILSGVAGTAWNALFNVVPSEKRGQVLAFNNGVPSQIGVVLSGLLLILGERALTTTQIFLMGILVTLACGFLVWRMRAAYGQALVEALRAGRLEVFSSEETAFAGLQGDAAALTVATRALQDSKPATRRLAAEILGKMHNLSAVPSLTSRTADPEAGVRAAALKALGELQAASALAVIASSLGDTDEVVRLQALTALTRLEVEPSTSLVEKLETLVADGSIKVRTQAADALIKFGRGERAVPSLAGWLQSDDPSLRIAALDTFGKAAAYPGGPLEAGPVLEALDDSSVAVRQAACRALAGLKDLTSARALVARLSDPDGSVRNAAAASLKLRGPGAGALISDVLKHGNDAAREAALDAFSPNDPDALPQLQLYARQEIPRLRELRAQVASLPGEGQAVSLLRVLLQSRLRLGESRLVEILGLIGNPRVMDLVRKSMHGADAEARAAALEALETLGDKTLTREIVTLLEEEPVRITPAEAVGNILKNADRWPRALSICAAGELGLKELISSVAVLKFDPDALIRESAGRALIQLGEVKPMDTLQTVSTLERVLLLREVPIFGDLLPEDLEQVARIAREQWFPDRTVIFRQGEAGDVMFIIVSGRVQVVRSVNGKDQLLAQRGPGDFVGEMAIIDSAPRSAGLLTQGDVRMLAIEGEAFKSILRERPEVSLAVLHSLSHRLREMVDERK